MTVIIILCQSAAAQGVCVYVYLLIVLGHCAGGCIVSKVKLRILSKAHVSLPPPPPPTPTPAPPGSGPPHPEQGTCQQVSFQCHGAISHVKRGLFHIRALLACTQAYLLERVPPLLVLLLQLVIHVIFIRIKLIRARHILLRLQGG
jgi:hypothetical protein